MQAATFTLPVERNWYAEMEAYQLGRVFYAKEICLLSECGKYCYTWHVRNPRNMPHLPNTPATRFQYQRHELAWTFGNCDIDDVRTQFVSLTAGATVFVKGLQKRDYFRQLAHKSCIVEDIDCVVSNSLLQQSFCDKPEYWCTVSHGWYCATNKAYTLRRAHQLV